ncbi:MAG TPA: hypothetical protein VMV59_00535 [Candidatus Dormibacteraeota bacterium]|nr:hypothetical protein [Candidatus Dormibacteraeota bacterium]
MNTPGTAQYLQAGELRGILDDAIRFWELRRIPYNLVLVVVVVAWIAATRSHLQKAMLWPAVLALFVMAALANVLYSVAYCLDVFVQFSSFRDLWRRRRWMLWFAGVLLAVALANFWILTNFH